MHRSSVTFKSKKSKKIIICDLLTKLIDVFKCFNDLEYCFKYIYSIVVASIFSSRVIILIYLLQKSVN